LLKGKLVKTSYLYLLAAISGLQSGCVLLQSGDDASVHQVFYATTRMAEPHTQADVYGSVRGELSFGLASVTLPISRSTTERASLDVMPDTGSSMNSFDLTVNAAPLVRLYPMGPDHFNKELVRSADAYDSDRLLLYIHGFKRRFSQNVESAARLAYQLEYPGPVVVFSWPSTNALSGYIADRGNAAWSKAYFRQWLVDLNARFPEKRIDIVAHSMGNWLLVRALTELYREWPSDKIWPVARVVMLAPDVDRSLFEHEYAPALMAQPTAYTLYVSAEDFPLKTSSVFNAYPRLGDSSESVPVLEGITTVDVSNAITMLQGHAYYRKSDAFAQDLYLLLNRQLPASERQTLEINYTESGKYWMLKKECTKC
jgi:esterase/lipase superfamily enzyme